MGTNHFTRFVFRLWQFFLYSDQKLIEELYKASKDGHHEKVLQLLQRGVPPDSKYYEREQRSYRSPLYISCWFNRRQSAEYLLKWGASVATTLEGSIPLHGASSNNSIDCVKLLLEHHCPTGKPRCYCLWVCAWNHFFSYYISLKSTCTSKSTHFVKVVKVRGEKLKQLLV